MQIEIGKTTKPSIANLEINSRLGEIERDILIFTI